MEGKWRGLKGSPRQPLHLLLYSLAKVPKSQAHLDSLWSQRKKKSPDSQISFSQHSTLSYCYFLGGALRNQDDKKKNSTVE